MGTKTNKKLRQTGSGVFPTQTLAHAHPRNYFIQTQQTTQLSHGIEEWFELSESIELERGKRVQPDKAPDTSRPATN